MKKSWVIHMCISIFLGIFSTFLSAQKNETIKDEVIDRLLESMAERNGENADYTNLLEGLDEYFDHPLNLNSASAEDLQRLALLDETQIADLHLYIKKHGPLLSIYEVQLIKGWDKETIFLLLPFIQVIPAHEEKKRSFGHYLRYGKHEGIFRYQQLIENQDGFIKDSTGNSNYLGIPQQFYFRYRYTHPAKYSIGITAKKDRGESFFSGTNQRGFDFYSVHVFIKDTWKFRSLAFGDYQAQFGQGISFWKGYGLQKSAFSTSVMRNAAGLRAYTSANSNNYLRGGAFELALWKIRWTSFFSFDLKDAGTDSIENQEIATGLNTTGQHRTINEISKRETLTEIIAGNYVQFRHTRFTVGAGLYYTRYNKSLVPKEALYNLYAFRGQEQLNGGIDYRARVGNIFLSGEMGFDKEGNYALVQGLETSIGGFRFSFLYRDYSSRYNNLHSQAFGENGSTKNERGFYLGMEGILLPKISFRGYMDIYQFPWLRYNVDAPSMGVDGMLQLNYTPTYSTDFYLRYKISRKMQNGKTNDTYLNPLTEIYTHQLRAHLVIKVFTGLSLRSRIESIFISRPDFPFRWGFLAYQDVSWQPAKLPLSASARFAIFRTDDFDTRLYAYENDLLYNFSVPFYYDQGMRWYLNISYKALKGFSIAFRISQFVYPGKTDNGSGNDRIAGNTKTEIKLQVRYRFGNILKKSRKPLPEEDEMSREI